MKSNILTEKILIVDSNIDYAKFIQNALKKDGYLCYIKKPYLMKKLLESMNIGQIQD